MPANPDVFTATMSYHRMLKRAQELSPVLTYVVCKLLFGVDLEKEKHAFVSSLRVSDRGDNSEFYPYFLMTDHFETFLKEVFFNLTVRKNSACAEGHYLSAHRQFVIWLKSLRGLSLDDAAMEVTIPA